ncbi:hypothetical protein MMC20_002157 [Loxospora ochrophaea]|nr:hypothetical protein [Loxospora ochrophaea]
MAFPTPLSRHHTSPALKAPQNRQPVIAQNCNKDYLANMCWASIIIYSCGHTGQKSLPIAPGDDPKDYFFYYINCGEERKGRKCLAEGLKILYYKSKTGCRKLVDFHKCSHCGDSWYEDIKYKGFEDVKVPDAFEDESVCWMYRSFAEEDRGEKLVKEVVKEMVKEDAEGEGVEDEIEDVVREEGEEDDDEEGGWRLSWRMGRWGMW